jgi:hypothetical protein
LKITTKEHEQLQQTIETSQINDRQLLEQKNQEVFADFTMNFRLYFNIKSRDRTCIGLSRSLVLVPSPIERQKGNRDLKQYREILSSGVTRNI